MFSSFLEKAGPKHSTSVPLSEGDAVPLSVDEKEGPLAPVTALAVKALSGPHVDEASAVLCPRIHSLLPFTLQMVTPLLSPTVQLKVTASPGQVGGAAANCPATLYTPPGRGMYLI